MTLKVAIVVGNPKPMSRTLRIAELLVKKLLAGKSFSLETIDLAEHASEMFKWPSDTMAGLNELVARSHLVVVASPTYKATYTGLLKAFLDRYPANALRGVVAIPVMTGADHSHSMAPVVNLAPLLVELGATVPFGGFYFAVNQMDRLEDLIAAAASGSAATIHALCRIVHDFPPSTGAYAEANEETDHG